MSEYPNSIEPSDVDDVEQSALLKAMEAAQAIMDEAGLPWRVTELAMVPESELTLESSPRARPRVCCVLKNGVRRCGPSYCED